MADVTDHATICDECLTRYKTFVADAESLQTQYPNAPFERPNDAMWAKVGFGPFVKTQKSFGASGNNRFDVEGSLIIDTYKPIELGTKSQQDLIVVINAAFESTKQNGIVWTSSEVREVGRVNNDWLIVLTIPFTAQIFA